MIAFKKYIFPVSGSIITLFLMLRCLGALAITGSFGDMENLTLLDDVAMYVLIGWFLIFLVLTIKFWSRQKLLIVLFIFSICFSYALVAISDISNRNVYGKQFLTQANTEQLLVFFDSNKSNFMNVISQANSTPELYDSCRDDKLRNKYLSLLKTVRSLCVTRDVNGQIEFMTTRFLDSSSGYLYVPTGMKPNGHDEFLKKINDNWYVF